MPCHSIDLYLILNGSSLAVLYIEDTLVLSSAPSNWPRAKLVFKNMSFQDSSEAAAQSDALRGVVMRVTYRNPENSYSVIQCAVKDEKEAVTVVGYCLDFSVGTELLVEGHYIEHPKFGQQFNATSASEVEPTSLEGIEKYLGSGLIKGIGSQTAKKIVETFGEETLEVIYREPEKIAKISGVGKHKAQILSEGLKSRREKVEVERFLVENNVGQRLVQRIYDRYGNNSISILKRDPYRLAHEMRGVGFATADALALNMGFAPDSAQRLKAGVYYALERARDQGHCFLVAKNLNEQVHQLLGLDRIYDLTSAVEDLIREGYITMEEDNLYLRYLYEAEQFVARFVADRCSPIEHPVISKEGIEVCLSSASADLKVQFTLEQEEAVRLAAEYSFLVVTGGPGCGKTTVIKALAASFLHAKMNLVLAAPTGKAAQRMSQVCGLPAQTIHRLLKFDPRSGLFEYGINNPLCSEDGKQVDAVIIDEASMIDLPLAKDLFSAIPSDTHIVFVGDKDQLPSVGPGTVFSDLILSEGVKKISLSKLFRRDDQSLVNSVAHSINAGIPPQIPAPDGETKTDAYFIDKKDTEAIANLLEQLFVDQIPRKFSIERSDITILTPSNRGVLGTVELNQRIQARLHRSESASDCLQYFDRQFFVGDRVCQRVNNYKLGTYGVFNGDIGFVYSVNPQDKSMVVELWDGRLVTYEGSNIGQLSLAYAMTIHRSQGSELPCVLMTLHESQFTLLERQLFYTGVTRAKQLLVVVGSKRALAVAAKRTSAHRRNGMLKERLEICLS